MPWKQVRFEELKIHGNVKIFVQQIYEGVGVPTIAVVDNANRRPTSRMNPNSDL